MDIVRRGMKDVENLLFFRICIDNAEENCYFIRGSNN